MQIEFTTPTEYDYRKFTDTLTDASMLNNRVKIIARDDDDNTAELFIEQDIVDRLGKDYIRSHIRMRYNTALCKWFLHLSENDYYNDLTRNPEKIIRVEFKGIDGNTGREIYKSIDTNQYYLREVYYPSENFAKWYVCGKRITREDGCEPRANIIFEHNGQQEKVRYDDWNGIAAYDDTFNKDFNGGR